MITKKSISQTFSVLFIVMFLLTGVLPVQTVSALNSKTANLPTGLTLDDWAQIKTLLPAVVIPDTQQAYLKASNTEAYDFFGEAISLSGDTLVIAAKREDSNATGVNGDGTNNSATDSGAVYVFTRSAGVWSQQAYLKASNTEANDVFGSAVSISGDTLVVGARQEDSNATGLNGNESDNSAADSGAAYVFTRTAGIWSQQAYLKASNTEANDWFGYALSISGDTLVVSALNESSNANTVNGNQTDNSTSGSGAAYVFTRTAGIWSQQAYLKASNTEANDFFGSAVSIFSDTLVIGAYSEDSNANTVGGNQADNSALSSGAAYVFTRTGITWSQQAYLKASNAETGDAFGNAVSISGDTLVVGAYHEDSNAIGVNNDGLNNSATNSGAVYVFTRTGVVWSQQAYLKASNTAGPGLDQSFGNSLSLSNDMLVIGAFGEDSNAIGINGNQNNSLAGNSGAAYVFTRSGIIWSQQIYVKASNTKTQNAFGFAVAASNDTFAVGASAEESNATGINGNQLDNSATASGAAYVFSVVPPSVSMSSTASNPTNNSPITVNVTFSENVLNFISSDITAGNGTVSNFSGNGANYTFELTPTTNGLVTADIAAGVAKDNTDNDNTAATQFSRTYDNIAPSTTSFTAISPSSSLNIPITIFTASDVVGVIGYIITTSPTPPSVDNAGWSGTSPTTYTVGADGIHTLYPWAKDAAGNISPVFGSPLSVTVDATAPTVLSSQRVNTTPTALTSVDFTVTFSESVTGVGTDDFSLTTTGVSGATVSGVSGLNSIYTVTVNTGTGSGTIRLNVLNDGSIKDSVNNPLGTGFTSGEVYTVSKSAIFTDVPFTYWANSYIERLFNAGVTSGCGTGIYCPDNSVTRAQMAVFLLKGIHGSNFTPPALGPSTGFADIAIDYWAAAWIKQLAAEGITSGCGGGNFCPEATVTRAQMAVFLLKAKHGSSYNPPAATGDFTDVPVGYWADKWIEQLAVEGVTSGCGAGVYCPDAEVTRAQMAVFLVKNFNLP